MKPARLAEVVIKDFRVLYYAIPGAIRALWNGSGRSENFFLNFIWVTVQATTWMLVKAYCGVYVILTYRSLVVRYSESLADRGLIRCLIYVSLFNVALRTIFCFTKDMWNLGEDNGFHKMESSEDGHRGKKEKHLKSFDLYKWMKLSAREVLEFLFDYIYNLGKEELESDEDIKVKMIFHATEDQWEIPVGAEGTIRKTPGYGATFEGSKVFVHFHKGIRRVDAERPDRSTERSRRDSEKVDPKGSGKGSSPRRDQGPRTYNPPVKIPVDPTYLTEKNEKTDDAQEHLMKFLGLDKPASGDGYEALSMQPADDMESQK